MSDARAMLACLANDEVSRVLAHIVLHGQPGEELPASRRQKAVASLLRSGLIKDCGDGYTIRSEEIRSALSDLSTASQESVADQSTRWIDTDGRIRQYPRRRSERVDLLRGIGERVIAPAERLAEAEMNMRLARYTPDVPTLRRYLIVYGVLARESDGSAYWRV